MNVNYSDMIFALWQCENDGCEFVYMIANDTGGQMGLGSSMHYESELRKLLDGLGNDKSSNDQR
jgi:hypothetical protein